MAKKGLRREVRREVKSEVSDASRSLAKFIRTRSKEIREEISDFKEKEGKIRRRFHFIDTFGFVWPLISAFLGILLLLVTVVILNLLNNSLQNYFISALAAMFYNNLYLFFAISLFFGYADYVKNKYTQIYWIVGPVINSMAVVGIMWIFITALELVNPYGAKNFLMAFANMLYLHLEDIFAFCLGLGYAVLLLRIIFKGVGKIKDEKIV